MDASEFSASPFVYTGEKARQISFPLGGIGTGCIGLSGGGRLIDWEVFNRPNKGSTNGFSHFAVRAEEGGRVVDARILNGPYEGNRSGEHVGAAFRNFGFGATQDSLAGMPHFRQCRFDGRFPVAHLTFADPAFPGAAALIAFNPFIPMNAKESGLPAAFFEIALTNTTDRPLDYTVTGCLRNPRPGDNVVRPAAVAPGITGLVFGTEGQRPDQVEFGEFLVATDAAETSRQQHWYRGTWFDALEIYWRDMERPGRFADRHYDGPAPNQRDHGLVAAHLHLAPGESGTVRFLIGWYVPNCSKYWISRNKLREPAKPLPETWKNHYAVSWTGVEDAAAHAFRHWTRLRAETLAFRDALYGSTLPHPVLDAAAANLSILKSPTVSRLEDGTFYGWEGCHPTAGSCEGSCTHVWNYQQALPFLFPDLERSMRDADFLHNQAAETGGLAFRLQLPLGIGASDERACADGQFGAVMKAYRDWKLCGDDTWLRARWPQIRAALEYAWHPGNEDRWDPEKTGVLWGRQHHTLDMELFGPNAWLTGMYLGALAAARDMAAHLGEADLAAEYAAIFARGRAWLDANLFNGDYFAQAIDLTDRSILDAFARTRASQVGNGSLHDLYWSAEHGEIKYQIGQSCLLDQLLGQWHANLYGIEAPFDQAKVLSALDAMLAHNFKPRLGDLYNPCRVYGLEEEAGTIICAFPEGRPRPAIPVPYAQETFHGAEYAFGSLLMQYGRLEDGIRVFEAVRDRYAGDNRNPWNELECGSNYARSMASYAGLLALSGFAFDLPQARIGFRPKLRRGGVFRSLWSAGAAWGVVELCDGAATLSALGGSVAIGRLDLGLGSAPVRVTRRVSLACRVAEGEVIFAAPLQLAAGDVLDVSSPDIRIGHLPDLG